MSLNISGSLPQFCVCLPAGVTYQEDIEFLNYNFTADRYLNFTMQPREIFCFNITIIDDNIAEQKYEYLSFNLGVYNPEPLHLWYSSIRIQDNEGNVNDFMYYIWM